MPTILVNKGLMGVSLKGVSVRACTSVCHLGCQLYDAHVLLGMRNKHILQQGTHTVHRNLRSLKFKLLRVACVVLQFGAGITESDLHTVAGAAKNVLAYIMRNLVPSECINVGGVLGFVGAAVAVDSARSPLLAFCRHCPAAGLSCQCFAPFVLCERGYGVLVLPLLSSKWQVTTASFVEALSA